MWQAKVGMQAAGFGDDRGASRTGAQRRRLPPRAGRHSAGCLAPFSPSLGRPGPGVAVASGSCSWGRPGQGPPWLVARETVPGRACDTSAVRRDVARGRTGPKTPTSASRRPRSAPAGGQANSGGALASRRRHAGGRGESVRRSEERKPWARVGISTGAPLVGLLLLPPPLLRCCALRVGLGGREV